LFSQVGDGVEPGRLISDLNRFMWRKRNPIGMSCLAALFDPEHRRVQYAVAGQMSMVRLRAVAGHAYTDPLPGDGPLVGDRPETEYTPYIVDSSPYDLFLICSEAMGAIWQVNTDTAVHLRMRLENAGTKPLNELHGDLLEMLGHPNRRRGSTPVVVVRERGVH
ncbi:MAG: SpoIIE family protein phosphatase, partial [Myxococcota bacterium]